MDFDDTEVVKLQTYKQQGDDALRNRQHKPALKWYIEAGKLSDKLHGQKDKESLNIQYAIAECYLKYGTQPARESAKKLFLSTLNTAKSLLLSKMRHKPDEGDDELKGLARKIIDRLESVARAYYTAEAHQKADELYSDIYSSAQIIFGMPDVLTTWIRDNKETNAQKLLPPSSSAHSEDGIDDGVPQPSRYFPSPAATATGRGTTESKEGLKEEDKAFLLDYLRKATSDPAPRKDPVDVQQSETRTVPVSSIYELPDELMYTGSWASAVDQAKKQERWLMINFQKHEYLESLVLNRSFWSHGAIILLIRNHFLFLQYDDVHVAKQRELEKYLPETDGLNRDAVNPYPSVVVVDPITLHKKKTWMGEFPRVSIFVAQLNDFLARFATGAGQSQSHTEDNGFDDVRLLEAKNETPVLLRLDDCESNREWFDRRLELKTQALLRPFRSEHNHFTDKRRRRVRIAILDTGIDFAHELVKKYRDRKQIKKTKSWIPGRPGTSDEDGHGTHAAMLLLKVAPEAELYIARIFTDNLNVTREHVAAAILWAVDTWEVDIITMSFGFQRYSDDISEAIAHAVAANVLLFAAASNNGGNDKNTRAYPARDYRVFCIHSADHWGAASNFNPPPRPHEPNFSILGKDVVSASRRNQWECKSGTSVATPIAAATAALLLEFLRLPRLEGQEEIQHISRVTTIEGMKQLFLEMSVVIQGYNYVAPWTLLSVETDLDISRARRKAEEAISDALKLLFDGV
jgi:hypothetical protein